MTNLMPGAEPFFVRGGPVGVLLIHGFTASPTEMRPLAEALAPEGYTLLGVRLPQHGTTPADMLHSHWHDWFNAALDGCALLRDQCPTLFVMGMSMGGAIALLLGARFPIAGLVAMSTPSEPFYLARDRRARLAGPLSYIVPYWPKPKSPPGGSAPLVKRVAYAVRPLRSVPHFYTLIHAAAEALPWVKAPALLVHSRGDRLIPPENMPYIFERLGSADKEMFWLDRSDHVVTEDCEREQLFRRVVAFVRAHLPTEAA